MRALLQGTQHLVGWKAGGAVTDNGSQVLATALPFTIDHDERWHFILTPAVVFSEGNHFRHNIERHHHEST